MSDSVDSKLHGQPLVRLKISVRDTSRRIDSDIVCDISDCSSLAQTG